jgi:hypothetical protein
MEIKPTGPGANISPISNNDQQVNNAAFSRQTEASNTTGLTAQENLPLSSVLAAYRKSDLQDPGKVEEMLSRCTGDLLGDVLGQSSSSLSADEKSYLTGWLQNDPSIRGKLLNYLEKLLK